MPTKTKEKKQSQISFEEQFTDKDTLIVSDNLKSILPEGWISLDDCIRIGDVEFETTVIKLDRIKAGTLIDVIISGLKVEDFINYKDGTLVIAGSERPCSLVSYDLSGCKTEDGLLTILLKGA